MIPHKINIFSYKNGHQFPRSVLLVSSLPTQLLMIQNMTSQAKISVYCQNGFRGCQVEMKSEELQKHEEE